MLLSEQLNKMKSLIKEESYISKCPKCGTEQSKSANNCVSKDCGARLYKSDTDEIDEGLGNKFRNVVIGSAMALGSVGAHATNTDSSNVEKPEIAKNNISANRVIAGDPSMDHNNMGMKVIQAYKKINPDFWVNDSNDVKKVQAQIRNYRNSLIQNFKQGKAVFDQQIKGDNTFKNFMSDIEKTGIDGILGQVTSTFLFPGSYFTHIDGKHIGPRYDTGLEGNGGFEGMISINQMKEWNVFVDWMKTTSFRNLATRW